MLGSIHRSRGEGLFLTGVIVALRRGAWLE